MQHRRLWLIQRRLHKDKRRKQHRSQSVRSSALVPSALVASEVRPLINNGRAVEGTKDYATQALSANNASSVKTAADIIFWFSLMCKTPLEHARQFQMMSVLVGDCVRVYL